MLQNILECCKRNCGNMIVNHFDKPYIAMVFSSSHFLMDTASDSRLGSILVLPILFNELTGVLYSLFHLMSFEK